MTKLIIIQNEVAQKEPQTYTPGDWFLIDDDKLYVLAYVGCESSDGLYNLISTEGTRWCDFFKRPDSGFTLSWLQNIVDSRYEIEIKPVSELEFRVK